MSTEQAAMAARLRAQVPACSQALAAAVCDEVVAILAMPACAQDDWDRAVGAVTAQMPGCHVDWARRLVTKAFALAGAPASTHPVPAWPVVVRRVPATPVRRAGDRSCARQVLAAWEQYLPQLLAVDWLDAHAATIACCVVAVLRMDCPANGRAIGRWLERSADSLDPAFPAQVAGEWLRLDTATLFCLRRWRQHHPDLATLGAAASQTDVIAQLQALAPSGVSGLRWLARSAEAWRRCKLPVFLLAGHERCALSGASRWTFDHGVQSSGVAPSAGHAKAGSFTSLPHLRATPPEALPLPRVAMERLRGLAARLRGTSVARADQSATLTRPQALAQVRDTLERDDWGALEQLVLTWMQRRLEDQTDRIRPVSLGRYLSALVHLVAAQGHRPLFAWDQARDAWQADPDHWEQCLAYLANHCTDKALFSVLGQLADVLVDAFPELDGVGVPLREDLAAGACARGQLIPVGMMEQVTRDHWQRATPQSRLGAMGTALGGYAGLRVSEIRGLRTRDVLDPDVMLIQVRSHRARRTKSVNAGRTIVLAHWLPAHWIERLRQLHAQNLAFGSGDGYLLCNPGDPAAPMAYHDLNAVLQDLRQATGNRQLVFHSLRHSAINHAFLRLMLFLQPRLRAYPAIALGDAMYSPEAIAAWLDGWLPGDEVVRARTGLFELARVMGHGSALTTLRWYVHVLDLIERGLTTLALPTLSRQVLACLLGVDDRGLRAIEARARSRFVARCGPHAPLVMPWAITRELDRLRYRVIPSVGASVPSPVPAPGNRRLSAVDVPALLMAVHQGDSADIALRFGTCREVVRRLVDASAGLDETDLARLLARRERASFRQACQVLDGTWGGGEAAAALVQWRVGGMHLSQRQWPPALLPGLLGLVARLAGDWNGRLALQLCLHRWPQAPGAMAQARIKALAAMDAAGCPGKVIDGAGPVPGRATAFWQGCVLTVQLQDSAGGRTVCRDACAALVAAGCLVHAPATCRT